MASSDPSEKQQAVEHIADEAFSSEQREDIWALIIAAGIFLLSVAFPAQIHSFFSSVLVLF